MLLAIDRQALDKLRELVGGEESDLMEIVSSFLEEGPSLFEDLLKAHRTADLTLMRRSAHSIKSNARDMGALELAEICARIEMCSASGAFPVESEFESARNALTAAVAELQTISQLGDSS